MLKFSTELQMKADLIEWKARTTLQSLDVGETIHIRHKDILNDTLRHISKESFKKNYPLHVKFIGEDASDTGGPKH